MENKIVFHTLERAKPVNQEGRIMSSHQQHPSSYRDPSGFVFESSGKLFRQINKVYQENYELLMSSGLYQTLVEKRWLISHEEISSPIPASAECYRTILPEQIAFISYPYEWCLEQVKDAAILTLNIMRSSMNHGMIFKDATPYNIQFKLGQPVHIDTLSFEKYDETKPWVAYRQFCECFLYPLLIVKYTSWEVHRLFSAFPEGISAKETAEILPGKARLNLGNWLHIFLPASIRGSKNSGETVFSKTKLLRIVDHLFQMIDNVEVSSKKNSSWKNYYNEDILNEEYLAGKQAAIKEMVKIEGKHILDLGCNQGIFSRILEAKDNSVVAADSDAISISTLYKICKKDALNILPLCVDIMNPPGSGGFMNQERKAFADRLHFDACMALALVHHLAIGKNVPFEMIAAFCSRICNQLIIEFVSKDDEKVQQLLSTREDIFDWYDQANFENAFLDYFSIEDTRSIEGSNRIIFRMKNKKPVDLK